MKDCEFSNIDKYVMDLLSKAKHLAKDMIAIIEMINKAPVESGTNVSVQKAIETTEKLIGLRNNDSLPSAAEFPRQDSSTQEDNAFWAREDVIQSIEDAIARRTQLLTKVDDVPSFSLGITQILNTSSYEDMQNALDVDSGTKEQDVEENQKVLII